MDRRHVLRMLGAAVAATGLSAAQLRALGAPGAPRVPRVKLFTDRQRATVEALADVILPRTDTPGALDVGVPDYIELIVGEWYDAGDRSRFLLGLWEVDAEARRQGSASFVEAGAAERGGILHALEEDARRRQQQDPGGPPAFFHRVRGLVLHGYYTSEVGMTEELGWQIIPGRYNGCVDVASVTRAAGGH